MDKPLYTFEPMKHATDWVLVGTFCLVALMLFMTYLIKKYSKLDVNRRNVLIMVCFFIGIIAAGTAIFRLISMWKLKPVQIYSHRIETPYGTAELNNVRDFYIKIERHYKPMNPDAVTDSARYFFLLERNDKTHVLSEGDYEVDSILAKLNDVMGY
jgi:O-antigen/teichoic acid export membrane protein